MAHAQEMLRHVALAMSRERSIILFLSMLGWTNKPFKPVGACNTADASNSLQTDHLVGQLTQNRA